MILPTKSRVQLIAGAALFAAVFHVAFARYLTTTWEYYGFAYRNRGLNAALMAYVLALIPSLWMPTRSQRPSMIIAWTLYYLVYVPSMFCVPMVAPRLDAVVPLLASLLVGMMIIALSYRLPLGRGRIGALRPVSYRSFVTLTWLVAGALLIGTGWVFRETFSAPSLERMYEIRFAARLVQREASYVSYFTNWLSRAVLPLLLVVGLLKRRALMVATVMGAYLVLFMTTAHKAYFIVPFVVAGTFFLVKWFPNRYGLVLMYGLNVALVLTFVSGSPFLRDLVFMRTMGWSGLASYIYYDFSQTHPLTWWSHVKGISWFIPYPYSETIPFVVGFEYWGNPELSSNAHFWAMDGIAAAGTVGVVVISGVAAVLFRTIDRVALGVNPLLATPWLAAYATYLADAGLFSALLTGGLAVVTVAMHVAPCALRAAPRVNEGELRGAR